MTNIETKLADSQLYKPLKKNKSEIVYLAEDILYNKATNEYLIILQS